MPGLFQFRTENSGFRSLYFRIQCEQLFRSPRDQIYCQGPTLEFQEDFIISFRKLHQDRPRLDLVCMSSR